MFTTHHLAPWCRSERQHIQPHTRWRGATVSMMASPTTTALSPAATWLRRENMGASREGGEHSGTCTKKASAQRACGRKGEDQCTYPWNCIDARLLPKLQGPERVKELRLRSVVKRATEEPGGLHLPGRLPEGRRLDQAPSNRAGDEAQRSGFAIIVGVPPRSTRILAHFPPRRMENSSGASAR